MKLLLKNKLHTAQNEARALNHIIWLSAVGEHVVPNSAKLSAGNKYYTFVK